MPKRVLKNVPENRVDRVIKDFERDGCTATKEKQLDGTYTVTADCPDKRTSVMPGGEMPE